MAWVRMPWRSRSRSYRDWRTVQAGSEWRDLCHPMTGKVVLKYNVETGEVAIKDGGWVYVMVLPELKPIASSDLSV